MPTLKQVTCSLQLGLSGTKLKEYGHHYTDGGVEAYIAVPDTDIPFHIRVTSSGYIAPGLAVYVFMDGQYQCNRNRQKLRMPREGADPREHQVDFVFRQSEEKASSGQFVAREWTFAKLKTANADDTASVKPTFAQNVGTIEVIVLRCKDASSDLSSADRYYTAPSRQQPPTAAGAKGGKAVQHGKRSAKNEAVMKAASKVATDAASKKASQAGDEMLGGLFGLFDGAGDDYEYQTRARGYYPEQPPNSLRGQYDHQQQRQRPVRRPIESVHSSTSRKMFENRPAGISFVIDLCKKVEDIFRAGYDKRKEAIVLQKEAQMYENDADLQLVVVKALRQKESDMNGLDEEVAALFAAIFTRMRRMERDAWNYTRDYLVVEKRLVPAGHSELQEWPDPRLQRSRAPAQGDHGAMAKRRHEDGWQELGERRTGVPQGQHQQNHSKPDDGWQELGEKTTEVPLWQRKQNQAGQNAQDNTRVADTPRQDCRGEQTDGQWNSPDDIDQGQKPDDNWNKSGNGGNNNDAWGTTKKEDGGDWNNENQANGNNWADTGDPANKPDDAWGGDNKSQGKQNQWDNDQKAEGSQKAKSQGNDWANKSKTKSSQHPSRKGSNNGWDVKKQASNRGWDDSRSQNHESKVRNWNDSSSKHETRRSQREMIKPSSTANFEPVIKPYWADWNSPKTSSSSKPKEHPRDAYEYPAAPLPILPSSKTASVSHAVAAGRGADYAHETYRPEYLDTMERPYAIFTFKYRSRAILENVLNRKIDTSDVQRAVREHEREELLRMSKDELVRRMIRMEMKPRITSAGKKSAKKPASACWGNQGWGADNRADNKDTRSKNGGGGDWHNDETQRQKTASNKPNSGGGWANNDADAWGAAEQKVNNGGDGGWQADKGSSKTANHFDGDRNMQQTKADSKAGWGDPVW